MKINGKEIAAKPIDFNAAIRLNELGGDIFAYNKSPLSALRAYLAYCMGTDAEDAGNEIEKHIIGGGDLHELVKAFAGACNDSAFFRAMVAKAENAETENGEKAKA